MKAAFDHWAVVIFSIAYHYVVYDPLWSDNEARSAVFAVERLQSLGFEASSTERVRQWILATKTHLCGDDDLLGYFIDADLSVLGTERERYLAYATAIRKEYGRVPDLLYKPGRKKVLRRFLERERIFQTEHFRMLYEEQARDNITAELNGTLG